MNKLIFTFSVLFVQLSLSQQKSDVIYQSYLAHITAANSSLRLNEKGEAKRWLENTPSEFRGWEWNYLNNGIEGSTAKLELKDITPTKITYSQNGKYVVFGDLKGTIHIHDSETLEKVKVIEGHSNTVYSLKFMDDDSKLVSCSRDTTIRIWDFTSGKELWQTKTGGRGLADVDVSPDGELIAYCSWYFNKNGVSGFIQLYDLIKKEKIWQTEHNTHPLVVVKFSPDGKRFAVGSWEWQISIWDVNDLSNPKVFDFNDVPTYSAVDDIAFSSDGKLIAAATKNTSPRVWEIDSGKLLFELKGHQKPVYAISYSKDGSKIYTSGDDAVIMIWDASTGKRLNKIFGHEDKVHSLAFSPDGKSFITASIDKTIRKWDAGTGMEFKNPNGRNKSSTYALDISKDGKLIAMNGPDSTLSIWNAESGKLIRLINGTDGNILNAVTFNNDGSLAAICNWGKTVKIYNTTTGELHRNLQGSNGGSAKILFSHDDKTVAIISTEKAIVLWDVASSNLMAKLSLESRPFGLRFSEDGKIIAAGEANGKITFWDTKNFVKIKEIQAHRGQPNDLVFSPDDKFIFSAGEDGITKMWDVESGKLVKEFKGHSQRVNCLAISIDGKRLASGSSDLTLRLWDITTGESVMIISDFSNPVYNVLFYPDEEKMIVNSSGAEVLVYDASP